MFDSILVVCFGNICRSPTGEKLLKKMLPNKNIYSAGVGALIGRPADATAIEVAMNHGVILEEHRARQLTAELCRKYDLILAMERKQIDAICKLAPEVRGKTMLYGHWNNQIDIPDPYHKSREAFEYIYRLLNDSAQKWVKALSR
ncbi:protein tyrosine phosphatase [Acerihabitans sp. KWT182]|uniref:protein-tyrosine-phosphatase n=1 Tax=Acerihabitans sp. KWT182 TaxID=3157919 RepID=A0AAU7Q5Y6_9GAMM